VIHLMAGVLLLAEEAADQVIINGKIGPAGYMIQHPCEILSYQRESSGTQLLRAWRGIVEHPPEAFGCLVNDSVVAIMFCSVRISGPVPIV